MALVARTVLYWKFTLYCTWCAYCMIDSAATLPPEPTASASHETISEPSSSPHHTNAQSPTAPASSPAAQAQSSPRLATPPTPAFLSAPKRYGKTPAELAELSTAPKRKGGRSSPVLSQVAKRRKTIDDLLGQNNDEDLAAGGGVFGALVAMLEERDAAREEQYWRERETSREERDRRRDEMFLAVMAKREANM